MPVSLGGDIESEIPVMSPTTTEPPGELLHEWTEERSPSQLRQADDGSLTVWVRFGTLGWSHIWNAREQPDGEIDLQPVAEWQGHPAPYAPYLAVATLETVLAE